MSTVAPDTRSWFRQHKILTVVLAFLLLAVLGSIFGEDAERSTNADPSVSSSSEDTEPNPDDSTPTEDEPTTDPESTGETKAQKTKTQPPPATQKPHKKPPPPPEREPRAVVRYLVTRVIDGDTVEVAKGGGTSVRIIGIDTPETVHPSVPVECGGPRASTLATQLPDGERVRLMYDPSQGRTDSFGRTLAYLQVPRIGDFGLTMIKRGAAAEYTYDTAYARQDLYRAAERTARASDRGLWRMCGSTAVPLVPSQPPPTQPEPGAGTDPRFDYCYEANDAGYGPYYQGTDPEYPWYDDADGDGIVCET